MFKFSFSKAVFFLSFIYLFLFFVACKKDIARKSSGDYAGTVEVYRFSGSSQLSSFNATIKVTKLNKSTVRMEASSAEPFYNFNSEYALRKDGTFGDGFHTPRGSFLILGNEGKFFGDSLTFSFANTDSIGNISYWFRGNRN